MLMIVKMVMSPTMKIIIIILVIKRMFTSKCYSFGEHIAVKQILMKKIKQVQEAPLCSTDKINILLYIYTIS